MTENNDGGIKQPPAKRPRLSSADGFARRGSPVKIPAPKFDSAFDSSPGTSTTKLPSKASSRTSHLPRLNATCQANFTSGFGDTSPIRPKPLSKIPARPSKLQWPDTSRHIAGPAGAQKSTPLRVLEPPAWVPPKPHPVSEGSPTKKVTALTSRLPFPLPSYETSAERKTSIHQLHPRLITPPRSKKVQPLMKFPAPPLAAVAGSSRSVDTGMKTISTTNVALATDPRSEGGSAELLSIFLQQHGHSFTDPTERELQRGLGQSPEKASKSKKPRYIRGGLAEQASRQFAQSDTALSLWQTDMQRPSSARIAPDLRLRIVSVSTDTDDVSHHRPPYPPRLGIARCCSMNGLDPEERTVLLNFGDPCSLILRTNKVDDLQEGGELHLWRPWHTIDALDSCVEGSDPRVQGHNLQLANHLFLNGGNILLCSRFRIVPALPSI
ncbi:hypothetical protein AcV5_010167 [Taiwanofungus camphoratus]|nr:hypothetical protein AcV5_010167 [Antrodia cinnamomea]KAI0946135.1 hypothetical protein AcV7_010186 [Antrodia cinnamomea]